jgi:hypothetical protein
MKLTLTIHQLNLGLTLPVSLQNRRHVHRWKSSGSSCEVGPDGDYRQASTFARQLTPDSPQ